EIFSLQEMIDKFDWARCNKSDGKFDPKKLLAKNHEHLKQERLTSIDGYIAAVIPFLEKRGLAVGDDDPKLRAAIPTIRERARTYVEAAEALDFFFREPPAFDDKAIAKFLVPASGQTLDDLAQIVADVSDWTRAGIEAAFDAYLQKKGLQIKDVAQPARVALTGRSVSPGIYETIDVLGRDLSVSRLRAGAQRARAGAQVAAP